MIDMSKYRVYDENKEMVFFNIWNTKLKNYKRNRIISTFAIDLI